MEENISKYSYSLHKIIKAGVFCSLIICVLVYLHGLIAVYYIPSSILLDTDTLISRMIAGIVSYFLAAGLVFYTKDYLQKVIPAWVLISCLGLFILILSTFPYLYIGRYFEELNCEKIRLNWSACSTLNTEQFILIGALALAISFAVIALFFVILHYFYKTLSKSLTLK